MPQKQQQKRPSPLEDPPTASSSSESEEEHQPPSQEKPVEEEEASSEEEASESEDDEEDNDTGAYSTQPASKTTSAALTATNSHPKPSESESATQSDSESDTDSDQAPPPPPSNTKVKPLATKPMDHTVKPKAQTQPSPAPAKSAAKRAAENNTPAGDPKRAKKKGADAAAAGGSDEEVEEDEKKSGPDSKKLFQRVWSVEDEIAILKGLGEFISKTGNDPMKYPDAFYDFVKKSLNVDANSTQLRDKIRRMKKKFETQAGKGKNGEGPNFSKAHGQKSFELSKKLWGRGGANEAEEKPKSNGKPAKSPKKEANSSTSKNVASAKKSKSETKQESQPDDMQLVAVKESAKMDTEADTSVLLSEMFRGVGVSGLGEDVAKRGVELIGASKRAELEGKWKKLKVAELELFVKRAQLIEEQSRLILEAYKSSNN